MEWLWQVESSVDAVHPCSVSNLVDVGHCTGSQFDQCHRGLPEGIKCKCIHPKRRNTISASSRGHSLFIFRPSAPFGFGYTFGQSSHESDGCLTVHFRYRICSSGLQQAFGVVMLYCERFQFRKRLQVNLCDVLSSNWCHNHDQ